MRRNAPDGFSPEQFYKGVRTFQDWEIFPGHRVAGSKPVARDLGLLGVPQSLTGTPRVLEIGPWNGFFGFELLRRGAGELVALGPDDPEHTGFNRTVSLLDISDRVQYIRDSVYNIESHNLGKFDVVLFLGVIYHLRHPLLALDLLHDLCHDQTTFLMDSPTIDNVRRVAVDKDVEDLDQCWKSILHIPLSVFVRGGVDTPLADDRYNWFVPNSVCLRAWFQSSGFAVRHEYIADNWMWLQGYPTERPFARGLEGFNASRATEAP